MSNIYYTSQNTEHILHKSKCRTYITQVQMSNIYTHEEFFHVIYVRHFDIHGTSLLHTKVTCAIVFSFRV